MVHSLTVTVIWLVARVQLEPSAERADRLFLGFFDFSVLSQLCCTTPLSISYSSDIVERSGETWLSHMGRSCGSLPPLHQLPRLRLDIR